MEYIPKNITLTGSILVASPTTNPDSYFAKAVIYIVSHHKEGSVGLVVNHPIKSLPKNLYIKNSWDIDGEDIKFENIKSYAGGPIDIEKGFILHSTDYEKNILEKNKGVCLSSNLEVLKDIQNGKGPKDSLFLFGYCGWGPGQLEKELKRNMWLVLNHDLSIIFNKFDYEKWPLAMKCMHINPSYYSTEIGNC